MPSDDGGSITRWITDVKAGDEEAAHQLWHRYFDRLASLARVKLGIVRAHGAVEDEEDVVIDAFDSFCRGAVLGRFPLLSDREDLWRLLAVITVRKALDQRTRQLAARRGGGMSGRGRAPQGLHWDSSGDSQDQIVDREPTPELAVMLAEEYRARIDSLKDKQLQQIAVWRMEGYTEDEIADRLGCARRTVARRVELIRLSWSQGES